MPLFLLTCGGVELIRFFWLGWEWLLFFHLSLVIS